MGDPRRDEAERCLLLVVVVVEGGGVILRLRSVASSAGSVAVRVEATTGEGWALERAREGEVGRENESDLVLRVNMTAAAGRWRSKVQVGSGRAWRDAGRERDCVGECVYRVTRTVVTGKGDGRGRMRNYPGWLSSESPRQSATKERFWVALLTIHHEYKCQWRESERESVGEVS